ncbi:6-bladed beta-propeller [Parabacteroides sp. OttesenSCG-928-G06]|nr:6-bladed beta-propeller [Parabacteroides sp. OttesenSCG-928-G06]
MQPTEVSGSLPVLDMVSLLEKEPGIVPMDDFFSDIRLVQLETSDEILINAIRNVYLYRDLIYTIHDNFISVFDQEGHFIRHISGRGGGPMEFVNQPNKLAFINDHIIINDNSGKRILLFTLEGEYVNSFKVNKQLANIQMIGNDLLAGSISNVSGSETICLQFYDLEGNLVDSVRYMDKYRTENFKFAFSFGVSGSFTRDGENIHFKDIFNDTIYRISDAFEMHPAYVVNLGKRSPDIQQVFKAEAFEDFFKVTEDKVKHELFYEDSTRLILKEPKDKYFLWDKIKNKMEYVRFRYNDEMLANFSKKVYEQRFHSTAVVSVKSQTVTIDNSQPTFTARSISEDNQFFIGTETPANEIDNPIVVLARIRK